MISTHYRARGNARWVGSTSILIVAHTIISAITTWCRLGQQRRTSCCHTIVTVVHIGVEVIRVFFNAEIVIIRSRHKRHTREYCDSEDPPFFGCHRRFR